MTIPNLSLLFVSIIGIIAVWENPDNLALYWVLLFLFSFTAGRALGILIHGTN